MTLQALILAGGQSSRMGTHKELLPHPSGAPMYQYLLNIIGQACPELDTIYMSVKNEDFVPSTERHYSQSKGNNISVRFIYDYQGDQSTNEDDIGPAAGLIAAYRTSPETHWLVVACDFPLLKVKTLTRLLSAQQQSPSLTCYRNSKGFCEPLLAVWSSEALEKLAGNVRQGRTGPRFVVDELPDTQIIRPENEVELFNVNTVKEWEEACNLFRMA